MKETCGKSYQADKTNTIYIFDANKHFVLNFLKAKMIFLAV